LIFVQLVKNQEYFMKNKPLENETKPGTTGLHENLPSLFIDNDGFIYRQLVD